MTFQADDISISVEVINEQTGAKLNANVFTAGKYQISSISGVVLFTAFFPGAITILNDDFVFTYPRTLNTHAGGLKHEMRVRDGQGNESTIVQQFINNKLTSVRL